MTPNRNVNFLEARAFVTTPETVAIDSTTIAKPMSPNKWRWLVWSVSCLIVAAVVILGGRYGYRKWQEQQTKAFTKQCRQFREKGDWEQLANVSKKWNDWDAGNADAILFRAEAAQGQDDLATAADLLAQLPETSPKRIPALMARTSLLLGPLNRPLEGIQTCQLALEINPRVYLAHQRLIFYYAITLQNEKLLAQIHQSLELECEPVDAYSYLIMADDITLTNGFEVNNNWLKGDINQEEFLVARTIHMWNQLRIEPFPNAETVEKIKLAEKLLSEYRQRFPKNAAVIAFHIEKSMVSGDLDQIESLLAAYPSHSDSRYWRYRGWWLAGCDRIDESESAYRESLKQFPLSWMSRHELADVLRRKQQFREVVDLEKLVVQGKDLREKIMKLPDVQKLDPETLREFRDYADQCGDQLAATSLNRRVGRMTK